MEKPTDQKTSRRSIAFVGGTYSLVVVVVVAAILVLVNVLVSALPTTLTKFDISSSKLYSITSNTKAVVNALDQEVTIYWIVQADQEDDVIENLLDRYDALSDSIQVEKRNPDVYPTFAEQYTDETVQNNSLVVESGDRSRFIGYDDIYLQETDAYSYSYTTSFDGEGAITSAIDYVVNADQPQLYVLEGHGETGLPSTFSDQIEKENIEIQSLSLLTEDSVPEEADALMVYEPQTDISEDERDLLVQYVSSGGKLLVIAGPSPEAELDNLYGLLENYGIEAHEGIVIEGSSDYYAFGAPYALIPDMAEHEITNSLLEERYYVVMQLARGLTVPATSTGGTVTGLLTTSDLAFSKIAGYELSTYEKEDGDIDGPFTLGVAIDDTSSGQIVWFTAANFLDDETNAYSSGANGDLAMNALSSMLGESEAMAIRSKSLNYNYLTISESDSSALTGLMLGVLPLGFLGVGTAVILVRRKVHNAEN